MSDMSTDPLDHGTQQLDFTHHSGDGCAPVLRDYQTQAIDDVQRELQTCRAVVVVAATGSGKTVIAAEFIRRNPEARILFLAPRRELIHQTCRKLKDVGVKHGVILAGDKRLNLYSRVQVASVDTMLSRVVRKKKYKLPDFDYAMVDECHIGLTQKREALLNLWPNAKIIGLTATPCRSDGKTLGRVYDKLVEVSNTAALTERGYLVEARYFSVSTPDLKKVRTTGGDYNLKDLAEVTNTAKLVGDVVEHWVRHAIGRRTVVFNVDIAHSAAMAAKFCESGIKAEHVDANTPQDLREEIFQRFASGETAVLCNCTLASIGFDLPELDCVILNRSTKSLGLYLQMLGRGLRPAPAVGKKDCLVLDHAGNVHRHGFATDERFWTLSGTYAVDHVKTQAAKEAKAKKDLKQITCPQCKCVWEGSNQCPACKYTFPVKQKDKPFMAGSLVEILRRGQTGFQNPLNGVESDDWTLPRKIDFYSQLVGIAQGRGYKPGWAACKYKDRFNVWPDYAWNRAIMQNGPAEASIHTIRWVTASQRAWKQSQRSNRELA
jgi:DNA repair protein RadD